MSWRGWTVERVVGRAHIVDTTEPTRGAAELTAALRCATYGGTWKVRRHTASGGRTVRVWQPAKTAAR